MKHLYFFALFFYLPFIIHAQKLNTSVVYTEDINRFWVAFDSVNTTKDTVRQAQFIQKIYIDKSTDGLKAFMKARDYDAKLWVRLINMYPKFWRSIKKNTLLVKNQAKAIVNSINNFKKLYSEMRPAKMYFTIGGLNSGGTTLDGKVLVGTEIAAADKNTDASELSGWLKNVFKTQKNSNIVSINVHEYVHTQQKFGGETLLTQALIEGTADFIAELVTGKKNNNVYMIYGREHEDELKQKFRIEMFSTDMKNWLYNGSGANTPDLGYFMGYVISKAYYQNHPDKKQAIKKIIELDYKNMEQVIDFVNKSKYYSELISK